MIKTTRLALCFLFTVAIGLTFTGTASALISDDFEVDSSGDYTVAVLGDPADGGPTFNFDYIAAGIPLAPNSAPGSTGGLKFTANDSLGADNAFTAFHNTVLPANVVLTVDMYIGVTGFSGTTEYAHVGVGGDGVTPNTIFSPTGGSGDFIAIDGDGGVTSDYRWARPATSGGLDVPNGVTPDPSFLAGGSDNGHALYQGLFPTGTPQAGSPGNLWTTLEFRTINGQTQISLDGTPIIFGPAIFGSGPLPAGLASIGYADVFGSVAQGPQSQFVVFDNFSVVENFTPVPEPTSVLLLVLGGLSLIGLRRRK